MPDSRWIAFFDKNIQDVRVPKKYTRQGWKGAKTGLSMTRWLELAFEYNELLSIQSFIHPDKKPLTDAQILINFAKEFNSHVKTHYKGKETNAGKSVLSGVHGMGFQRNKFRKGKLYSTQQRPMFMSFKWFSDGNCVKDSTKVIAKYPTFEECQKLCIQYKTADPRFFDVEKIERLVHLTQHNGEYNLWRFPSSQELLDIGKMLPVPLYRTVKTYDLFRQQKNKPEKNKGTLVDQLLEDQKVETDNEIAELELRRLETQRFIASQEGRSTKVVHNRKSKPGASQESME